ncbi:MAG: serine protease, partial [Phycisphaerales bacterium]|nr:serine protease [Hyphomonadaceae bacterium]
AGRDVGDSRSLTRMVGEAAVGAQVPVEIIRDGRRMVIAATIERLEESESGARASRDDGQAAPRRDGGPRGGRIFGVALSELDASLREEFQIEPDVRGLVVLAVDVGGENEGVVRPGDVIEAIGAEAVDSLTGARTIAGRAAVGEHPVVVRINREGGITYRRLRARS